MSQLFSTLISASHKTAYAEMDEEIKCSKFKMPNEDVLQVLACYSSSGGPVPDAGVILYDSCFIQLLASRASLCDSAQLHRRSANRCNKPDLLHSRCGNTHSRCLRITVLQLNLCLGP